MGLIPVYDADGNPLLDAGGGQIYVNYDGPTPSRLVDIPFENRIVDIPFENRIANIEVD